MKLMRKSTHLARSGMDMEGRGFPAPRPGEGEWRAGKECGLRRWGEVGLLCNRMERQGCGGGCATSGLQDVDSAPEIMYEYRFGKLR